LPIGSEVGAATRRAPPQAHDGGIGIFVVAEARPYRDALVLALAADARFSLVGTAGGVDAAIVQLERLPQPPQVLLLDHGVAEGCEAVPPLLRAAPPTAVVVVAVDETGEDALAWAEAGAAGFVARDASLAQLRENILAVAHGETLCSPRLTAMLVDRVAAHARERRDASAAMAERVHAAAARVADRGRGELGVRLLGTFGLRRGAIALPALPTQRSEALLAYLVIQRDRLVHRDVLCGDLWGDRSDAEARKSLRTTLWRARSVLEADASERGTLLRVDGDQIGFVAPPDARIDVWELDECVRLSQESGVPLDEATARRLGRVAALYRGDLMEGHYDDWCTEPRERLRTGFLAVLERLVSHHESRGAWQPAIACAQQILRHDPFREHVHRSLMTSHHAMGDRPSALRQYRHCAEVLRRELDIEPMDETRALHERIRAAL
jgi:DNA-binding SARP family transcriptional activator/DNA-binding NarL/FixJ family response regulator